MTATGNEPPRFNPYRDSLVHTDSVLRHLPNAISIEETLRLHALADAADIVDANWRRLIEIAGDLGASPTGISLQEKPNLFSACWSIIDSADVVRQLAASMSPHYYKDEINALATVRKIRNKRAHLPENIKNLSAKKKITGSIFGSISYAKVINRQSGIINLISISSDNFNYSMQDIGFVNPSGQIFFCDIGLFEFSSMGVTISVELLMSQLKDVISKTETAIEQAMSHNSLSSTRHLSNPDNWAKIVVATFSGA